MAVDKLVDSTQLDADLTSVANAIRTKGGTSAQLAFPAGFVSAVESIPTGGGSIDLSEISVPVSQNSIGGLFKALEDGTWDSIEMSVTSGTNPIVLDFGRTIKGLIVYPKSITALDNLPQNEMIATSIAIFNDPDGEGVQTSLYAFARFKSGGGNQSYIFNRITSYTLINGELSLVPQYPGNASYHPFAFGYPYIFVYWW